MDHISAEYWTCSFMFPILLFNFPQYYSKIALLYLCNFSCVFLGEGVMVEISESEKLERSLERKVQDWMRDQDNLEVKRERVCEVIQPLFC